MLVKRNKIIDSSASEISEEEEEIKQNESLESSDETSSFLSTDSDQSEEYDPNWEQNFFQLLYSSDHFCRRNAIKDEKNYFSIPELELWLENKRINQLQHIFRTPTNINIELEEELERKKNRQKVNELVRQEFQARIQAMNDPEEKRKIQSCRLRTKMFCEEILQRKPKLVEKTAKHRERRSSILQVIPQIKENIQAQHQQRKSVVLQNSQISQTSKESKVIQEEIQQEENKFQKQMNKINDVLNKLENPEFQMEQVKRASVVEGKKLNQQQIKQQLEQLFAKKQNPNQMQQSQPTNYKQTQKPTIAKEAQFTHMSMQRPRKPGKKGRSVNQQLENLLDDNPYQQPETMSVNNNEQTWQEEKVDKQPPQQEVVIKQPPSEVKLDQIQGGIYKLISMEGILTKQASYEMSPQKQISAQDLNSIGTAQKGNQEFSNLKIEKSQTMNQNLKKLSDLEEQIAKKMQARKLRRQETHKKDGENKKHKNENKASQQSAPKDVSFGANTIDTQIQKKPEQIAKIETKKQQKIVIQKKKNQTFNHKSLAIFNPNLTQEFNENFDLDTKSLEYKKPLWIQNQIPQLQKKKRLRRWKKVEQKSERSESQTSSLKIPSNIQQQEIDQAQKNNSPQNNQKIQEIIQQIEDKVKYLKSEENSILMNKEQENSLIEIFQCQLSPIHQYSIQEASKEESAETQESPPYQIKQINKKEENDNEKKGRKVIASSFIPSTVIQEEEDNISNENQQNKDKKNSQKSNKRFSFPGDEDFQNLQQKQQKLSAALKSKENPNLFQKEPAQAAGLVITQVTSTDNQKNEEIETLKIIPQQQFEKKDKNGLQKNQQPYQMDQQNEKQLKLDKNVLKIPIKEIYKSQQDQEANMQQSQTLGKISSAETLLSPHYNLEDNKKKEDNDLNSSKSLKNLQNQEKQKNEVDSSNKLLSENQNNSNILETTPNFQDDSNLQEYIESEEEQQMQPQPNILISVKSIPKTKNSKQNNKINQNVGLKKEGNTKHKRQLSKTPQIKREGPKSANVTPRIYNDKSEKDLRKMTEKYDQQQRLDTYESNNKTPKKVKLGTFQTTNKFTRTIQKKPVKAKSKKAATTLNSQDQSKQKSGIKHKIDTKFTPKTPQRAIIPRPQTTRAARNHTPLSKKSPRQASPTKRFQNEVQNENLRKLLKDLKKTNAAKQETLFYLDCLKANKGQLEQLKEDLANQDAKELISSLYELVKKPEQLYGQKENQKQKVKEDDDFQQDFQQNPKQKLQQISQWIQDLNQNTADPKNLEDFQKKLQNFKQNKSQRQRRQSLKKLEEILDKLGEFVQQYIDINQNNQLPELLQSFRIDNDNDKDEQNNLKDNSENEQQKNQNATPKRIKQTRTASLYIPTQMLGGPHHLKGQSISEHPMAQQVQGQNQANAQSKENGQQHLTRNLPISNQKTIEPIDYHNFKKFIKQKLVREQDYVKAMVIEEKRPKELQKLAWERSVWRRDVWIEEYLQHNESSEKLQNPAIQFMNEEKFIELLSEVQKMIDEDKRKWESTKRVMIQHGNQQQERQQILKFLNDLNLLYANQQNYIMENDKELESDLYYDEEF